MSACVGSCVGGPIMEKYHHSSIKDYINIEKNAGKEDFDVGITEKDELRKSFGIIEQLAKIPQEDEIKAILCQMGKTEPAHELNCGSCGYNSCREKAIAIYQGKADISMCLPFLKDKAENFSDTIVNNNPDGILVLNEKLEVQQVNAAARRIMNLRAASDILGDQVIRVLDPTVFAEVLRTGRSVYNQRTYLAEYAICK